MKKTLLRVGIVCVLAVFLVGCGESYDIQTDTEFHAAADTTIEQGLRGEDTFDELYETFSDRYSVEEMDEFVLEKYEVVETELMAKLDDLNQKLEEEFAKEDEYLKELEEIGDIAVYESLLEKFEQSEKRLEELDAEFEASEDLYRMIEILEEMITIYEDTMTTP